MRIGLGGEESKRIVGEGRGQTDRRAIGSSKIEARDQYAPATEICREQRSLAGRVLLEELLEEPCWKGLAWITVEVTLEVKCSQRKRVLLYSSGSWRRAYLEELAKEGRPPTCC